MSQALTDRAQPRHLPLFSSRPSPFTNVGWDQLALNADPPRVTRVSFLRVPRRLRWRDKLRTSSLRNTLDRFPPCPPVFPVVAAGDTEEPWRTRGRGSASRSRDTLEPDRVWELRLNEMEPRWAITGNHGGPARRNAAGPTLQVSQPQLGDGTAHAPTVCGTQLDTALSSSDADARPRGLPRLPIPPASLLRLIWPSLGGLLTESVVLPH